jgi:hypothetical protein
MQLAILVFLVGVLIMFHIIVIVLRLKHIQGLQKEAKHWRSRWQATNKALQDSEALLLECTLKIKRLETMTHGVASERRVI